MPLTAEVLFEEPQHALAPALRAELARCRSVSIVTGFATPEGVEAIAGGLRASTAKLATFVVGAATYRGFEALDTLVEAGVPLDRLFVHLGHTRPTKQSNSKGKKPTYPFYRYHPMLHSKVYYLEMPDGTAVAFIGSHNATGFALLGLNGEAGVLLRGPASDPEMAKIRRHVAAAQAQAVPYIPTLKDAYTWWMTAFVDGLRAKVNDRPREAEAKRTIVILAAELNGPPPAPGEIVYFEIPSAFNRIWTINSEVHIYIFDRLPPSPVEGLYSLSKARHSLWCLTLAIETNKVGKELDAQWQILDRLRPVLQPTAQPFRPAVSPGMVQLQVGVRNDVWNRYEYLFDTDRAEWSPEYDRGNTVQLADGERAWVEELGLIPPEHLEWMLVRGLCPADPGATSGGRDDYRDALRASAPEAGGYILMSTRRRLVREHRG